MTEPAEESWEQANEIHPDRTPLPPLQSWPPPPPRDPTKPEPPQLRLVSPSEEQRESAPASLPLQSLGLTRPSVTSDLDSELQAAREELHALHELLEELPAIFESKFQLRLKAALQDQKRLLGENQELRRSLAALPPGSTIPVANPSPRLLLPPALERASSLGQTLRQVLRRNREDGVGDTDASAAGADVQHFPPEPTGQS
ncbi:MAG: hypothetical protein VKI42_06060 [Synechococcaceae cyanobacterium]|nr:hypothetical protein [Synechococcaceae cyanobacterium]